METEAEQAALRITLFGPMDVLVHGQPLPYLRSRKSLYILALLTLRHNRPVEREWLAGTLWPDADQSQGLANLRPALSALREALGQEGHRIESPSRHTLRLDLTGAVEADTHDFDAAMTDGELPALERAVSLYRGALLEGCAEEWVFQERSAREQDCLRALEKLADAALSAGDYTLASGRYQRAVALAPLSDAVRRGLMEAQAKSGDINAALQTYREFVHLLREDPRAAPDAKTTALYQQLRQAARQGAAPVAPAAPAVPVISGYLPHALTELIGREDERIEVASSLKRSRLVTLTGPGGIGKTRLAVAVVSEVVGSYDDGAGMVSLEALADPALLPHTVAQVLGVREKVGVPLMQTLLDSLRAKRHFLLILDNCEHLLDAAAELAARLLRECAGVRILATSREPLGITGEVAWAVPALAFPDPVHLPTGQTALARILAGYDSVRLFVERAQAVQRNFTLEAGLAPSVAHICSYLEGVPLAIELAAARVNALTVEQIAARLHDRLNLLSGKARSAMSRQQTLRATLDWSYALLNESERAMLRRLSVFAGGWILEAAEEIASDKEEGGRRKDEKGKSDPSAFPPSDVLDLLTSLTEKSLIAFEAREGDSEGRFRMLEMVRHYAAERLDESGEGEGVREKLRQWLTELAEETEPQLEAGAQEAALRRLERERENFRATLLWGGADAAANLRLTGPLYRYWYVRGYWSEGREHLNRALAGAAPERTAERAKVLDGAGALAYSQGDYAAAQELHQESLSIRREWGDKRGIATALYSLGNIAYDQGDYAAARPLYEESLERGRELDDKRGVAWSLYGLGNIAHPKGEYETARSLYHESSRLLRELGDRQGVARSLNSLGYVAYDQGDYPSALALFAESRELFAELGDIGGEAWSSCCIGYTEYDRGDYDAARESLVRGRDLFQELKDQRGFAWAINSLGNVSHRLGDLAAARALHEESLGIRRELGDKQGMAWSLYCVGKVAHNQGDYTAAWASLGNSLILFREMGDRKAISDNLEEVASVANAQGDREKAARMWAAAQTLRESIGAPLAPLEQERSARYIENARLTTDAKIFAAAWDAGSRLTWEEAVAEALLHASP